MTNLRVRAISKAEWGRTIEWKEAAPRLKRRAEQLISGLKTAFAEDGDYAHHGVIFSDDVADSSLALVETPLRKGRLQLDFLDSDNALLGRILVQRKQTDSAGQVTWGTVWHVTFGDKGRVYAVEPAEAEAFDVENMARHTRDNAFIALGMSINYALLAGPIYP